jgi:hypothetical protein
LKGPGVEDGARPGTFVLLTMARSDVPNSLGAPRFRIEVTDTRDRIGSPQPNRYGDIGRQFTWETAEPLGVSPPEAVDLFLIKNRLTPRLRLLHEGVDR